MSWACSPDRTDDAIRGWVDEPTTYWFRRCCHCGKWRIRSALYDAYPERPEIAQFHLVCPGCMVIVLTATWERDNLPCANSG